MRLLLVRWRDCATNDSTFKLTEAAGASLIEVETVGHLVAEHKDRITVACEYFSEQATCRHIVTIPRVNIEEVVELMPHKGGYPPKKKGKGKKKK